RWRSAWAGRARAPPPHATGRTAPRSGRSWSAGCAARSPPTRCRCIWAASLRRFPACSSCARPIRWSHHSRCFPLAATGRRWSAGNFSPTLQSLAACYVLSAIHDGGYVMRMGLAIDAACDLSQAFLEQHDIAVMPITVKIDRETFMDDRKPSELQRFIDRRLGSRSHSAETEPCPVEEVQKLFLEKLVLEQDCVFCLTITATRSPINEHVNKASFAILKNYRHVREQASILGPFMMRVIDTRNIFAGAAPAVYEASRMIAAGEAPAAIRERLLHIANHSYGYMLPRDLYYLRARAKTKNDRSVSLFSAMLGSALDIKPILRCFRGETGPVG